MLERVLETLLARLDAQPAAVLGRTPDGRELRVERTTIGATVSQRSNVACVAVSVELPEVSVGTVHIVLCRWDDMPGVLVYHSLDDGAKRPQWTHVELTDDGLHLVVKWEEHDEPYDYLFEWVEKNLDVPDQTA